MSEQAMLDKVILASQLEVGQMVKRCDGYYSEIVDLMAAGLGAKVAIFLEEDEEPIVVSINQKVTVEV